MEVGAPGSKARLSPPVKLTIVKVISRTKPICLIDFSFLCPLRGMQRVFYPFLLQRLSSETAGSEGLIVRSLIRVLRCGEHQIHPIVGCLVGLGREAAGAILIDAIAPLLTIDKGSQRCVRIRRTEVLGVSGIMPSWRSIRHHIRRIGCNGYWCDVHLLPARLGFTAKGRAGQLGPGARPVMRGVRTCIPCTFVKADPGNLAIDGSLKLDP